MSPLNELNDIGFEESTWVKLARTRDAFFQSPAVFLRQIYSKLCLYILWNNP
jgi:hypothetical protein